jgi:hypothetical protein
VDRTIRVQVGVALATVSIALSGCGGGSPTAGHNEVSRLRAITALYFRAASSLGRNPASEAEFKQAIADTKPDLGVLGVGSIDELFVSERDGKPIVVRYGPESGRAGRGVVAYEQEGVDGVRLVGSTNGQIQEADAAKFAQLVPQPAAP